MTATVRYPSREVRDAVVESNMEAGAGESFRPSRRGAGAVRHHRPLPPGRRPVHGAGAGCAGGRLGQPDAVRGLGGPRHHPSPDRVAAGVLLRYLEHRAAAGPSVDDDPVRAWQVVDDAIRAALDDPEIANLVKDTRMGPSTFAQTIDTICTADILIHTWDLARATGLDETLDAVEVHRMFDGIEPMDEMLRQSGQYGPRVEVPDDADEQSQLIAFMGRQP